LKKTSQRCFVFSRLSSPRLCGNRPCAKRAMAFDGGLAQAPAEQLDIGAVAGIAGMRATTCAIHRPKRCSRAKGLLSSLTTPRR